MKPPSSRRHGLARNDLARLPLIALLCLTVFLPLSRAQDVTVSTPRADISTPAATVAPDLSTPILTIPTTLNTTSSMVSTPTDPPPPELFPAATSSHVEPVHNASVFNYYFLFLFIFAVLVAALLLWIHRRRQQHKRQLQQSGQHALARDLEGWAGARRFVHGSYGRYQTTARVRREEGLDEHGEAPPPYEPKNEVTVGAVQDLGSEVAVPLRTLTRDANNRAPPPEYSTANRTSRLPSTEPRSPET